MKKVCGLIKKFLNVKQHYKLAKTKHPGCVKFTKYYLVCAVAFVLLGTSLTFWQDGELAILFWIFLALLPLTPLFIFLLMYLTIFGGLLYGVVIFSPIWVPLFIWSSLAEKRDAADAKAEAIVSAATADALMQNEYRQIGIEQKKPENKLYATAKPGVYFDGQKIIIKTIKNNDLIKSIKGLDRRAWNPVLVAWVCPVSEFAGVLGISKRYDIPLDETFANLHASTDTYADPLIPGSNSGMLKLHNDGTLTLSTKRLMKIDEGYVYIIHDKVQNLYKIGKSINPEKRVKASMGGLSMETEAIHCAWFEDHGYAEKLLHDMFSAKRKGGEWFALDEGDIGLIKSLGQKHDLNPTEEQLEDRARFEQNRKKNYKDFKQREQRRNSRYSTSQKNKNNPNRW